MNKETAFIFGAVPAYSIAFWGTNRWSGDRLALTILGTWILASLIILAMSFVFSTAWKKHGVTWPRVCGLIILVHASFLPGYYVGQGKYLQCVALVSVVGACFLAKPIRKRVKQRRVNADKASAQMREAVFDLTCR